jgi:hypothetical protein
MAGGNGFGCRVSDVGFQRVGSGSHRLTPETLTRVILLEDFASRKLQSAADIEAADVLYRIAAMISKYALYLEAKRGVFE